MEMPPRQRWLALLDGRCADRVPCDYQATPEVSARLLAELGCSGEEELFERLHIDAPRRVAPRGIRPPGLHPEADLWGVRYREVDYGGGSYREAVHHPLAGLTSVEEVHAHRWPDPADFDYEGFAQELAALDGQRAVLAGCYEPFLLYGYLRGLERSYEDLALRPEIADAILGHLLDFHHEHHRRLFEAGRGRIDLTIVAEDLGTQRGPLISLEMYRRFLRPGQIRMAELARSYGIHVLYHSDGAVRAFLPDLIDEVGIEILDPIQWRCPGMEREGLVADFGERIVFHGSIDNQQTLAFGSPRDVEREVRESVEIYAGARWICAPCHKIQPVSPSANILSLYETLHALGAR